MYYYILSKKMYVLLHKICAFTNGYPYQYFTLQMVAHNLPILTVLKDTNGYLYRYFTLKNIII